MNAKVAHEFYNDNDEEPGSGSYLFPDDYRLVASNRPVSI